MQCYHWLCWGVLTPTHHHLLMGPHWLLNENILKASVEETPSGGFHSRESATTATHSSIPSPGRELSLDGQENQVAQRWQGATSTIYPSLRTTLLNSCSFGLSEIFIILMLSAWADQFLLLGIFLWRRGEISANSQVLFKLLNSWGPWADSYNRLRRLVFGTASLHRVSFSKKCSPSFG